MKIVVFGSTGGTGLQVIDQALARGHEVVAFARNPAVLTHTHPGLQRVTGDVRDAEAVRRAVAGADAAVSALGVRLGQPPGTVRSEGTRQIVAALTAAGVQRFVSVSTIGVGDSVDRLSWAGRLLLPRIIGAERLLEAEKQEQLIRRSTLDWTIIRPARLVDAPSTGASRLGTDLQTGLSAKTTRADLAKALLDQLDSRTFLRACPTLVS